MPHHAMYGEGHDCRNSMLSSSSGLVVSGGSFTNVQNTYLVDRPMDKQVLGTLRKKLKPDSRLFHNSRQHDGLSDPLCLVDGEDEAHLAKFLQNDHRDRPILRHNFCHPIQRPSKDVALRASHRLSGERRLLASIIVPLTHNMRPYDKYRIISTLAYQISRNIPSSAKHILRAIEDNPCILKLKLDFRTQITELIATPLILAATGSTVEEKMEWPNVIIVDAFAHQLTDNSILDQITAMLLNLSLHQSMNTINMSILVTSSTTLLDKAAEVLAVLHCYAAGRRGGITLICCYFPGRVTHALTPFGLIWPKRLCY